MPSNKQRREAERRRLQRQLARRHEREVRRRRVTLITSISLTVVLIAAVIVAVVGLSSNDDKSPAAGKSTAPTAGYSSGSSAPTSAASSPSTAAKAAYPCVWGTPQGTVTQRKVTKPSTTKPPRTGKVTVSVATNRGPMTFTLNRATAPCTVASFVSLVKQKFYDNTPCHRLTTQGIYVLQCGDPSGKGTGGPGYTVEDEAKGTEQYPAGTIAMARSQAANSGGSQFFIVYKDSPNLMQSLGAQQYTVFGTVSRGLGVVTKIAAAGATGTGGDGAPKLKTTITSMKDDA